MLDLLEQLTTHLSRLPAPAALEAACAGENAEAELSRRSEYTCLTTSLGCLRELAREREAIRPDRRVGGMRYWRTRSSKPFSRTSGRRSDR